MKGGGKTGRRGTSGGEGAEVIPYFHGAAEALAFCRHGGQSWEREG